MSYYYISNPYNGTDEEKEDRARVASKACAALLKKGIHAWSPIVHNHAMMKDHEFSLEERRSLILDFDFSLLRAARGMIVLTIDGWDRSYGVRAELNLCRELSIPVQYLSPADLMDATELNMRASPAS